MTRPVCLHEDVGAVRHGGVVECRWNLIGTKELCNRDPEEVWDDGM